MSGPGSLEWGQYDHIYNRGIDGQNLFIDEENYAYFLKLYAHYLHPVVETYAYCLLRNHFHLLIRVREEPDLGQDLTGFPASERPVRSEEREPAAPDLTGFPASERPVRSETRRRSPSQAFSNLFNAYAKAINKRHGRTGSLFERPFDRILVTSDAYFCWLVVYIHRNPEKHRFVDDFRDWPYSSYHSILSAQPTRLERDAVVAWFGGPARLIAYHERGGEERTIAPLVENDFD